MILLPPIPSAHPPTCLFVLQKTPPKEPQLSKVVYVAKIKPKPFAPFLQCRRQTKKQLLLNVFSPLKAGIFLLEEAAAHAGSV